LIPSFIFLASALLDPLSVEEHVAYYRLYPETEEGKKALNHAWKLLGEAGGVNLDSTETLPEVDLSSIISLVTKEASDTPCSLNTAQLNLLNKISSNLPNRKLKGSSIWTREDVLKLPKEEIDLARGLLLYQFEPSEKLKDEILQYEATLDLMALEIRARLTTWASDLEKIHAINQFIFEEKRFRFPPHSLYAKEIDLYTFLPSVLDNREGVCLGVSILYLCIAQRLGVPLEIITPPGHIYLRYNDINIETTARGIHLPSEMYLGINTRSLQTRTIKEVIGLAFANQAAVAWEQDKPQDAIKLYEKALLFLPQDPLIQMFLGFNYLFIGEKQKAKELLSPLRSFTFDYAVSPETIPADYLQGKADAEGIKAIFSHVDESRTSVLNKLHSLEKIVKRYPKFRAGLLQLAVCHLQLGHVAEGLKILESYHKIDPNDATVQYYLSVLYLERFDLRGSWLHWKNAEALTSAKGHNPKALKEIKTALLRHSPPM
jgi:regulator of sirC expression with transglutaminase-like and TPR domain